MRELELETVECQGCGGEMPALRLLAIEENIEDGIELFRHQVCSADCYRVNQINLVNEDS